MNAELSSAPFLALYAVLLVAILLRAVLQRRRICAGRPVSPSELDEYDLAMLKGGPRLAGAVALLSLERAGAVELGDRLLRELAERYGFDPEDAALSDDVLWNLGIDVRVTLAGPRPPDAHCVEAGLYDAIETSRGRRPDEIVATAAGGPALNSVRRRLVDLALLVDPADLASFRRRRGQFLPLLAAGVALWFAGGDGDRPVMLGLLAATAAAMVWARRAVPARTRAGTRVLEEVRAGRPETLEPPRPVDREQLAMTLPIAGGAALWAADPPLALAVGAEREDTAYATAVPFERRGMWSWLSGGPGSCGSGPTGCGADAGHGCGGHGCGGGGCGGGGGGCGGG